MTAAAARSWSPVRYVLLGGAAAAALDIAYAFVFFGVRNHIPPVRILQSVATGVLGRTAYDGGAGTALLGLALHVLIATTASTVYFLAAARAPALLRRPLASGVVYGTLVYVVMNLIVLPLSRSPQRLSTDPVVVVSGLLVHMFLIGAPIAFAAAAWGKAVWRAAGDDHV